MICFFACLLYLPTIFGRDVCVFMKLSRGIVLFAMTCGRLPYTDSNIKVLLSQLQKRLEFYNRGTQECQQLIRSILTINPAQRITIAEMYVQPWLSNDLAANPPKLDLGPTCNKPTSASRYSSGAAAPVVPAASASSSVNPSAPVHKKSTGSAASSPTSLAKRWRPNLWRR